MVNGECPGREKGNLNWRTESQPSKGRRLPVGKNQGTERKTKRTKAGMSLKINDMPICDRLSRFLEKGDVADLAPRGAQETNPRGLTLAVTVRYKNFGPNKPKPVIFPAVCQLQRKPARFSANLNADEDDPSRIRSLNSFDAPSHAPMRELAP